MINGPWIIKPPALPDTTPEQTRAGVEPDPAVRARVLPVIFRKVAESQLCDVRFVHDAFGQYPR
jgi:hypothetical protein